MNTENENLNSPEDEEDIEKLFNDFIEAIKNLPQKDKDQIYNNLKEMEQNNDNN